MSEYRADGRVIYDGERVLAMCDSPDFASRLVASLSGVPWISEDDADLHFELYHTSDFISDTVSVRATHLPTGISACSSGEGHVLANKAVALSDLRTALQRFTTVEVDSLVRRISAVGARHAPALPGSTTVCVECAKPFPCPTRVDIYEVDDV